MLLVCSCFIYLCVPVRRWIAAGRLYIEQHLLLGLMIQLAGYANVAGYRVDVEITVGVTGVDGVSNHITITCTKNQKEKREV